MGPVPNKRSVGARPPSGGQIELSFGDQHATVVEVGGGLRTYRAGDWDVLDGYAVDERCREARGQPLIPWPIRLQDGRYAWQGDEHQLPLTEPARQNAIHGLVRFVNWTPADHAGHAVRMEHVLHPQDGYPFTLELAIEYVLGPGGLSVRTSATNVGTRSCPYGAGAHPYVSVGTDLIDSATLLIPANEWLHADDRAIPDGRREVDDTPYDFRQGRRIGDAQLDTAFAELERGPDGMARVLLSANDGSRQVAIWMDAVYRYVMAFTGDSLPEPRRRRRSLAIEPMTCAPNAFRSGEGLITLEPGHACEASWGIEPRRRRT
jgi:aldose 1-epimerase